MVKVLLRTLAVTILVFFVSLLAVRPALSVFGYSSAEASYHLVTHALLVSLVFVVVFCTQMILGAVKDREAPSAADQSVAGISAPE